MGAFWRAGIDAGYAGDDAPGERSQYGDDYYGAFLLDPDGNSAEAVHHGDTRRGGYIDHLWIGVADLETRRRGSTTSSLATSGCARLAISRAPPVSRRVGDVLAASRRPPAHRGLHLALPAPDRRTVEDFHRAAIAAGYRDNGATGERAIYHPGYYAAYVLTPEGTNVESVFHERR